MKSGKLSRTVTARRLGWAAAIACIGCCAIPVIALALGVSAVAGLGIYLERASLGLGIAAAALFAYALLKQRARSCRVGCSCKSTPNEA